MAVSVAVNVVVGAKVVMPGLGVGAIKNGVEVGGKLLFNIVGDAVPGSPRSVQPLESITRVQISRIILLAHMGLLDKKGGEKCQFQPLQLGSPGMYLLAWLQAKF